MTLRVHAERREQIEAIIDRLAEHVTTARTAPDTGALRKAINEIWNANHDLADLTNTAEREAREAALAKLEQAA